MYEIKKPQQSQSGIIRRNLVSLLALGGVGAVVLYSGRGTLGGKLLTALAEGGYLDVMQNGNRVYFGYKGNIYTVKEYRKPLPGQRTIEDLVGSVYPHYNASKRKFCANLAAQMHSFLKSKGKKRLINHEVRKMLFGSESLKYLDPNELYPIPIIVSKGKLSDFVK